MSRYRSGGVRGPIGFLAGLVGGLQQGMPGLLEAQREAREAKRQEKLDARDEEDRTQKRMSDLEEKERKKLAPYLRELDSLAKRYQGNPEALKVIAERRERLKRGAAQVTGRDVAEVPNSGEEGATYQPQELSHATSGLTLPGLSDEERAAAKVKEDAEAQARIQRRQARIERRQARKETRYQEELDAALAERQVAEGRLESDDVLLAGAARAYTSAFDEEVVRSRNYPKAAKAAAQAREEYLRVHAPRVKAAAPVRPEQFTTQLPQIGVQAPPPPAAPGELPRFNPAFKLGVDYSPEGTLGGLLPDLRSPRSTAGAAPSPTTPSPMPGSGPRTAAIRPVSGMPRAPEPLPVPPFSGQPSPLRPEPLPFTGQSARLRPEPVPLAPGAPGGGMAGRRPRPAGGFGRTGGVPGLPSAAPPLGEAEIKRRVLTELGRVEQQQGRPLSEAERNAISRKTRAKLAGMGR